MDKNLVFTLVWLWLLVGNRWLDLFGLVMVIDLSQSLRLCLQDILLYVQNPSSIGYVFGWLAWVSTVVVDLG